MLLSHLFENVDSDTASFAKAEQARMSLYNYLYGKPRLIECDFEGIDGVIIFSKEVPGLKEYEGLAFFFSKDGPRQFREIIGSTHGITHLILLSGGDTPATIMNSLFDHSYVFIHEFTHYLDGKRLSPTYKPSTKTVDQKGYSTNPKVRSDYHNKPVELNAFFTTIAEPLLTRLADRKTYGGDSVDFHDRVPENFNDYLKGMKLNKEDKMHMKSLTPENRRKLLSRLYRLHSEVVKDYR